MPATWKKVTMINMGTGRRCRASAMTFCPVRPSVMHNEANVSMHSMITIELILICFVVDWIDDNLHNFDRGMLKINAKPTPFNVHSTDCKPPRKVLKVILEYNGQLLIYPSAVQSASCRIICWYHQLIAQRVSIQSTISDYAFWALQISRKLISTVSPRHSINCCSSLWPSRNHSCALSAPHNKIDSVVIQV